MVSMPALLSFIHVLGLTLAVGGATVKLGLVVAVWILGPVIDKVVEPRFERVATGEAGLESPEGARAMRRYLAAEATATGIFYVIMVYLMLT